MRWKLELDKNHKLVILTYNGLISTQELYDSSSKTIALTNQHKINKVLVESKMYRTNSNRTHIFKMLNELYGIWGLNRSISIAVIEPKDIASKNIIQFYELAAKNLRWEARVFPNKKAALNWLLE